MSEKLEKLLKMFHITSVCREDIVLQSFMKEQEALNLTDGEMEEIADGMAEAWLQSGFWEALKTMVDYKIEQRLK